MSRAQSLFNTCFNLMANLFLSIGADVNTSVMEQFPSASDTSPSKLGKYWSHFDVLSIFCYLWTFRYLHSLNGFSYMNLPVLSILTWAYYLVGVFLEVFPN